MAAIRRKKIKNTQPNSMTKLDFIHRLETLNKFQAALKILKSDELLYEKWSASTEIKTNDSAVRSLLENVGLDPDKVLSNEVI